MSNLPLPVNNNAIVSPQHGAAITPNDTTDLTNATLKLYVGGTGDLVVILNGDSASTTFKTMPVGMYDLCVSRILATGTTATNLVALW